MNRRSVMNLKERCVLNTENKSIVVLSEPGRECFEYRMISINTKVGNEPDFQKGVYDQPIILRSTNQVIEIVEDKEIQLFSTFLNKDKKRIVKLRCARTKDGYVLSFPDYYPGMDLSRVHLVTKEGVPLYFGTGNPGNREWIVKDWNGICRTDRFCEQFIKIEVVEE